MVVDPTARPVTENAPVVLPAAIVTVDGFRSTIQFGLVDSVRSRPPVGAGEPKVIVPLMARVIPTFAESNASVIGMVTFATTDAVAKPSADAVRVALPILPGVIFMFAPVEPWGS